MKKIKFTPGLWTALWIALSIFLLIALWTVIKVISPAPPRTLSMSTGVADGAYHQFGLKYQALLKANGITLELKPSSGSVENLRRLVDGEVSVGFVQGGLAAVANEPDGESPYKDLRSLATTGFEPVWIFSSTLDLSQGLGTLRGKKVAVGVAGSGNHKVATELLGSYGLPGANGEAMDGTQLVTEGGPAAAKRLQAQELDAVIMIAAPQAAAVKLMLGDPGLQLASLVHAPGLARRYPYFQTVSLKRGSVDPAHNLPPNDITLLATTANLVVRADLHPALAYLLLEAAQKTHNSPSLLTRPGEFPSPQGTDFALADEASRYFKNGSPFLQTYLPFWMANFVQRLVLVALPLLAILLPLFKGIPPLLAWRQKSRLYRRYGELKFLEQDIAARTLSAQENLASRQQLDQIEREIIETRFPLDFTDRVYTLRQHVDYVRAKLVQQTPASESADTLKMKSNQ